jgi:hypothetical protein
MKKGEAVAPFCLEKLDRAHFLGNSPFGWVSKKSLEEEEDISCGMRGAGQGTPGQKVSDGVYQLWLDSSLPPIPCGSSELQGTHLQNGDKDPFSLESLRIS